MSESIYTLVKENKFIKEWLFRNHLSGKLNSVSDEAKRMVRNESKRGINIDDDLRNYCGELTDLNKALKRIQALRVQEKQVKDGTTGLFVVGGAIILGLIIYILV